MKCEDYYCHFSLSLSLSVSLWFRSQFKKAGSVDDVRKRIFQAINHINLLYKPLRTHVALIGLEVWSAGDKIKVSTDSGKLLDDIMRWRNSQLLPKKNHDNLQFITNLDFNGDTIGLAYVKAMCTENSGAVNQDHASSVIGVASTIAHEMGHNLGMSHDQAGCYCQAGACIMAPSIG
uniref:Peptidase M12B domain-containing protein n=1 Tax=Callorhinchus milii TaxID=7868 RepID=A0A4W3HZ35_CALMI